MRVLIDILVVVFMFFWVVCMIAYDNEPYSLKNGIKRLLSRDLE